MKTLMIFMFMLFGINNALAAAEGEGDNKESKWTRLVTIEEDIGGKDPTKTEDMTYVKEQILEAGGLYEDLEEEPHEFLAKKDPTKKIKTISAILSSLKYDKETKDEEEAIKAAYGIEEAVVATDEEEVDEGGTA